MFRRTISPSSGKLTQAYFVLPDVINVKSGQGCEYSSEIAFEDMPIYLPGGNKLFDPKPAKLIKDAIALRCVYWNRKGNNDFIKYLFMKHGKFDKMRGSFTSDDTVPDTIKDESPVPTQQSWEGWHKLVRNAAAQQ